MYISSREVADTRDQTLHNLLAVSTACVEAGERLTGLFVRAGRDAIARSGRQLGRLADGSLLTAPAEFWIDSLPHSPAWLLEEAADILGATHAAVVQAAQSQIRTCDRLLVTAIDRTAQSSPWEGEVALAVVKTTLQSAGSTLHTLTDAALQTVELTEARLRQASGRQRKGAAKAASRSPRSRKAQ